MLGGDNGNLMLPGFVDANQFKYQTNATNQLQLFGNMASGGCSVDPVNYFANENISPMIRPNKRGRETDSNVQRQQKLQISLNYNPNNVQEEVDRSTGVFNKNLVSTGLRLSYDDDERNSSVTSASGSLMAAAPPIFHPVGDNLRIELDRQKDELDQFIKTQAEQMAKGIRDMNQRHVASFLTTIEKGISKKIQEKDLEIENINRKNKELVERIKQAAMEAQNWHYRAKYNESVVNVLKNNLQQAMSQNEGKEGFGDSEIDDAASYMTVPGGSRQPGASPVIGCRACKVKQATVLLVPCRHLCLCKDCDAFMGVCPVCQLVKTSSVEVFFS